MARPRLELPAMVPGRDWKRRVQAFVGALPENQGPYSIDVLPRRDTASQQAHGYYRVIVCGAFAQYLHDTGMRLPPEFGSFEDLAHGCIKKRCFNIPVVSADGEIIDHVVGSLEGVDRDRMYDFCVAAREYLSDEYHIETPEPDRNWRSSGGCGAATVGRQAR